MLSDNNDNSTLNRAYRLKTSLQSCRTGEMPCGSGL